MNILITGIYGFIGSNLGRHLARSGHRIYGTTTDPAKADAKRNWLKDCHTHKLGNHPNPAIFNSIDTIIHLAHDFRNGTIHTNIQGTIELAMQATRHGVARQVFASSYSAHQKATSEYGKTKYELESFFKKKGSAIIRPGLVLGNGGLFKRMATIVMKSPITPLLDGGNKKHPIVDIATLCASIEAILAQEFNKPMEFNIFHGELVSMRYLLRRVSEITQHKTIFLNLPSRMLLMPIAALQRTGFKTPITTDNLKGYITNTDDTHKSNIETLIAPIPSPDAMITEAVKQILQGLQDDSLSKKR